MCTRIVPENVLPPVEEGLQLVSRAKRAATAGDVPAAAWRVLVAQTDSASCWGPSDCAPLLQAMQVGSAVGLNYWNN